MLVGSVLKESSELGGDAFRRKDQPITSRIQRGWPSGVSSIPRLGSRKGGLMILAKTVLHSQNTMSPELLGS